MKRIFTIAALALLCFSLTARVTTRERHNRHPFETQFNAIADKSGTFKPGGDWAPYPKYTDRKGWAEMLGDNAADLIKGGEKLLDYQWRLTTAMDYIEFEKDGDRKHTKAANANRGAFCKLCMAELAEGKGRFIPQIINGAYFAAEISTWQYAVHTSRQKSHRHLPDPNERYISLGAANTAAAIAIAWHFFHEEWDKIDPAISRIVYESLDKNTFEPYLDASKDKRGHGWMGFGNGSVNNWNTYCNAFVLQSFLFAQQDPEKLLAGVEKCMKSLDNYMDYNHMDGACDEGPSYWGMAGCKVYEAARNIYDATNGQINLLNDVQLQNMCIWKSSVDLGDGWAVNYGDGGPRSQGGTYSIYRMGVDMDNKELRDFTIYHNANEKKQMFESPIENGGDLYRSIESARYANRLMADEKAALNAAKGDWHKMRIDLRSCVKSTFFPDTQTAVLRNEKGWILAPKGGFNQESHNHNDVGNFILFCDECPVFIDQGSGTYGKTTFSPQRYTANYHINSLGHNVPVINAQPQHEGEEFAARNVKCDLSKGNFTVDISGAYEESAKVQSWVRNFQIDADGATITDTFKLNERTAPDDIHFITWQAPELGKKGELILHIRDFSGERTGTLKMTYPKNLKVEITPVKHTNKSLSERWGTVHQVSFKSADKAPLSGSYTFKITRRQ